MTLWISANPNPATAGGTITICYDFYGSGQTGEVILDVTFDGTGGGMSLKLTPEEPCATITVPLRCTSILLQDMTGNSDDLVVAVSP